MKLPRLYICITRASKMVQPKVKALASKPDDLRRRDLVPTSCLLNTLAVADVDTHAHDGWMGGWVDEWMDG